MQLSGQDFRTTAVSAREIHEPKVCTEFRFDPSHVSRPRGIYEEYFVKPLRASETAKYLIIVFTITFTFQLN